MRTSSENFKTKIASRTEKGTEKWEKAGEICDHELRFISYLIRSDDDVKCLLSRNYGKKPAADRSGIRGKRRLDGDRLAFIGPEILSNRCRP